MTLLLLLFGTISDVFVVRATWPIVRYKNGTVGVKNDGGTVKVQSTDLIVDGNLSVSGSLFIQDRDLAEYEDRVSSLENAKYEERVAYLESVIQSHASALAGMSGSSASPPKCIPPGGDKLRFDGEKWICVCINSYYYGDECQYKTPYEPVQNDELHLAIHTCLIAAPIHGLCYDSPYGPMPEWNTSLVTSLNYAFAPSSYCCLNSIDCRIKGGDRELYPDKECNFWTQHNPDISKWDTSSVVSMMNLFGSTSSNSPYSSTQFNQNISQWDTSSVTSMVGMFYKAYAFNHYIGDWDTSKLSSYSNIFGYATAFQAKYTCASSSSNSVKPSSCKTVRSTWIAPPPPPSPPLPPPPPLSPPTDSVTIVTDLNCAIVDGLGTYETIGGKSIYVCNGYALLLAYNHAANAEVVAVGYSTGVAPTSPVSSNAHIVADMIDKSIDDIESVKFFCNTTNHERIMNFRTENDKIRSAMVDGVYNPGCTFSCTSAGPDLSTGYTLLEGHTTRLPATTTRLHNTATSGNDFGIYYPMWNGGTCGNCPPSYGWHIGAYRGTGVDPITDFQCDSESIGETDATSHQIWVKFKQ
ncbi:unnamed protein product [Bathycoccus prasinos]